MDNDKINIDFELINVQGVHVKIEEYMNTRLEEENSNLQNCLTKCHQVFLNSLL
jgi:hypothetical protein